MYEIAGTTYTNTYSTVLTTNYSYLGTNTYITVVTSQLTTAYNYIEFQPTTNSFPYPFDKWYSVVVVSSNAVTDSSARGILTISRGAEMTAGVLAYVFPSIDGGWYTTFTGSFSNWPFLSRSSTNGSTTMLSDLDMGGKSITNIGNTSLKFADGNTISSAGWTSATGGVSSLSSTQAINTIKIASLQ